MTGFPVGGGAMGALVRAYDWAATPLGPPEAWPQSLRTAVGMVLGSKFPACIVWGQQLVTIHNDAFRPILGAKPEALGRPFNEVWSEAWQDLEPIAERALAGEATFIEDFPLIVERSGHPSEAFFTFCYSPVRDETGGVAGFLNTVVETTGKVLAERRQGFLLQLEERLRGLADPHEITLAAAEALGRQVKAARAGYGEIDAAGEIVSVDRDWTDGTVASLAGKARLLDGFGPAVIAELLAGRTLVVEDCLTDPRAAGDAYAATWASIGTRSLVVVPLLKAGRLVAILYVHEPRPRRWSTAEISLTEDTAHRTWAAVERARAETALRDSEERLRFLDSLGSATAHASAPREVMAMTASLLGAHLGVTRCAYADVQADNDRFTIRDDWTDGASSSAGEYTLDIFGSRAAADMRAGRTLVVRNVDEELPAEDGGGMFNAIGIKAIVCCPLVKEGRLVAMMAVHESEPRSWTPGEIGLLETVVERAWAHIERVRAEAALRESEERFRLMADAVPHIVWITDAEGRVEFFNEQWFSYTGTAHESTTASDVAVSFVHPDDAAPTMERFEEARRTGGPFLVEHRIRSKDGDYRWFLVRGEPQRDPYTGKILRWFGASVDIHDRKRAEATLREREERLRLIVEGARDYAIFTTDPEGRIDTWLPGATNVFGWSPEEAIGQPVAITFTPEDRERGEDEKERETARREGTAPNVRWHLRKDGARVFIEGSATALRRPDGGIRGFLKIGQDVTARRAAEEARALLAREVDHRAKNALTVVQTMLRLTRASDVPSFVRAVEGRVAALARAQTLLAEGRWSGASLHAMLRGELAPFLTGQRVELDGRPVVLPPGTAQPLAMAVHELATNAAKHGALSMSGGRVSVSWRVESGAGAKLRLRWVETGGPPVAGPPSRRGFGSRVLEGTVRGQLGGTVSLTWETAGLVCTMEVPLGRRPASGKEAGPHTPATR
ncbi:PAS domain S-box protein [Belnapia sp. T6]|uniref:histidine kinase n=1 Tax=Belnapia mucosa TaxID=2804532 RepID=A0ABS1VBE1_9PROT|nr:PAS domain S-box protein [Belnapia mucosa]MBL6458999.1 PAS domain S-box protein [Belnapia mucosa]